MIFAPLPIRVRPLSGARGVAISTVRPNVGRPGCRRAVLGLALGSAVLAIGVAANAAPLLRPAVQTTLSVEKRQQLDADPHVMRWREARMAVDGVFEPSARDEPLALNLFPDAKLQARVRSAKTLESGSQFLSGRLVGGGRFTLFRSAGGILRGEFHSAAGVFTMRSLGPQRVLVKQQDLSKLSRCSHDVTRWGGSDPARSTAKASAMAPRLQSRPRPSPRQHRPDETVDVLVVYTPDAERSEGGREEIEASIEAEVEKTNQAFVNSGIGHRRITLSGAEKVDYIQSTEHIGDDLFFLYLRRGSQDTEGLLDEVHDLRKKYAADIVHLIVADSRGTCGIATIYSLYEENRGDLLCRQSDLDSCMQQWRKDELRFGTFSVSAIPEGCRSLDAFTHELGHNLGLYHDRYSHGDSLSLTDPTEFPYTPYGFGYVNQNFDRSECGKTIMAYGGQCIDEGYPWVVPELMFSNPDLQLGRQEVGYDPAGVAGEEWTTDLDGPVNASRAIDDVWDIVANLYHSSTAGSDRLLSGEAELLNADEAALDLSDYFDAVANGALRYKALTYSATVDNPDLASVSLVGSILTVMANEDGGEGVVTVTATVTGETGQTETLRFEVTISPRSPGGWRGWRTTLTTPSDGG